MLFPKLETLTIAVGQSYDVSNFQRLTSLQTLNLNYCVKLTEDDLLRLFRTLLRPCTHCPLRTR